MNTSDQATDRAAGSGAPGLGAWIGLRRPTGIRNGGLLLVLVALAAVMALVDKPPEPGAGPRLPGILQQLPPPVGILQQPPVTDQPPAPPATGRLGALADAGERPVVTARRHPRREHPVRGADAATRAAGGSGQGGRVGSRSPVVQPPVTAPTVASASVSVPWVAVRVRPPSVLGHDLPEVRAATPEVTVNTPAVEASRLSLG